MADAFFLDAKVTIGDKTAVTFDFACKMAPHRIENSPQRHGGHREDHEAMMIDCEFILNHVTCILLRVLRASVVNPSIR